MGSLRRMLFRAKGQVTKADLTHKWNYQCRKNRWHDQANMLREGTLGRPLSQSRKTNGETFETKLHLPLESPDEVPTISKEMRSFNVCMAKVNGKIVPIAAREVPSGGTSPFPPAKTGQSDWKLNGNVNGAKREVGKCC